MESAGDATVVTSFDQRTAGAVVAVLNRAGVQAWLGANPDGTLHGDGDVDVLVGPGDRERALHTLSDRMDDVRDAVRAADASAARAGTGPRRRRHKDAPMDPDEPVNTIPELEPGPPLVMERFRNLSWVLVILLVPLMVVTLAPTIRSDLGIRIAIGVAVVVIGVIIYRRPR